MGDSIRGDKSICLPVESEKQYRDIIKDAEAFRQYVAQTCTHYPEIFPTELKQGFWFHDFVESTKQQLPIRRIKLKENSEVYQLRPDRIRNSVNDFSALALVGVKSRNYRKIKKPQKIKDLR